MPPLPAGIIVIWRGAVVDIPAGWLLCDGSLGTPDLRDRFVEGAGGALSPDDTGGAVNHTHTFTSSGHTHSLTAGAALAGGAIFSIVTDSQTDSGTTDAAPTLPSFYALAYIQKS